MEYKKQYKILVVDDNSLFLESLKLFLKDVLNGQIVRIDMAENGREAIYKVHQLCYDVIFMDIDMPVMNGIEATKYLNRYFPRIIVVGMSMHTEISYLQKMIEAGSRTYIGKTELDEEKIKRVFSIVNGVN